MLDKIKHNELTIGEMVRASWEIFKGNFAVIALILLVIYIPIAVYIPTGLVEIARQLAYDVNAAEASGQLVSFILLLNIVSTLAMMIVVFLTENTIKGETEGLGTLLTRSLRRFLPFLVTMLLFGVIIAILTVLLVLPAIVVAPFIAFAGHVAMLRNQLGIKALKYSKRVVEGYWGQVFLVFLLTILGSYAVESFTEHITIGYAGAIIVALLTSFVSMFFTILKTVLFLNLDYIKESAAAMIAQRNQSVVEQAGTAEAGE